jgi:predicted amidohydrolase
MRSAGHALRFHKEAARRRPGCEETVAVTYDLILRRARVIDPSQKLDAVTDIAFSGGKVARIAPDLPADAGAEVRDLAGAILTPGLIDLHTHVYWGGTSLGIDAEDFCRQSGVTTAIDTGSAGPGNFAGFRKHVIEKSEVRILAYLHVSFAGIYAFSSRVMVGESEEIRLMAPIDASRWLTPTATSSSASRYGSAPAPPGAPARYRSTSRCKSPTRSGCR